MPGSGSQYGGYDAFSLAAFAPGDAFAGVRPTTAVRGAAARALAGGDGFAPNINLLGLGLVLVVLIALERFRP